MSTSFLDGPAKGVHLSLGRAPCLLRVVHDPGKNAWDALDQLDDCPAPRESVHVYRLVDPPGMMHISRRPRSQSSWETIAEYRLFEQQPGDDVLRDTHLWQEWAMRVGPPVAAEIKAMREKPATEPAGGL